jgi:hypothetical protein
MAHLLHSQHPYIACMGSARTCLRVCACVSVRPSVPMHSTTVRSKPRMVTRSCTSRRHWSSPCHQFASPLLNNALPRRRRAQQIPFGLCFWAGGTEPRKLTTELVSSIPGQSALEGANRGQLTVDGHLRVKGIEDGSVLGIGDAVR